MLTAARGVIGMAAGLAAALALPASAAEIRSTNTGNMPVIVIAGTFNLGDGERFERLTATMPKTTTVVFESSGGNLLAGLKMGEVIRARGYSTLVGDGSICASACAIAWLGGSKRYLADGARLGFHAASGQYGVSGGGNALVGAYMSKLGLKPDAIYELTSASPDTIAWLDIPSARTMGVAVERYTGTAFARSAPASRPAPQVATRGGGPIYPGSRGGSAYDDPHYVAPVPVPVARTSTSCPSYTYGGHGSCAGKR